MIKTIIKTSSAVLLLSVMFSGCGSETPKPAVKAQADFKCQQDGVLAPSFTCDPHADGFVTALGIAKMNAGGDKSFQRSEAMATARDALARQIEVKVSNLFKNYKGTTGSGADATFDKATSDVSKQLASQTLTGSKQIGMSWRNPKTKELFILVGVGTPNLEKKIDKSIKTSFKNDHAMYQKFLAKQANGELKQELENAGK